MEGPAASLSFVSHAFAEGFTKRLMLPATRREAAKLGAGRPFRVVGIDNGAFRRNHRYGTIVCNLERRRVVALLPDRERATAQA